MLREKFKKLDLADETKGWNSFWKNVESLFNKEEIAKQSKDIFLQLNFWN